MDPKSEIMEPSIETTSPTTESDDSCDTHADESVEHANDPDEVVNPQAEVLVSQKMTSNDSTHNILSRFDCSVFNITDPGEVHVAPNRNPEHIKTCNFDQPSNNPERNTDTSPSFLTQDTYHAAMMNHLPKVTVFLLLTKGNFESRGFGNCH